MTAVNELQSFTALSSHRHMAPPLAGGHAGGGGGVLVEGLQQAVDQFQRMAQNFRQVSNLWVHGMACMGACVHVHLTCKSIPIGMSPCVFV